MWDVCLPLVAFLLIIFFLVSVIHGMVVVVRWFRGSGRGRDGAGRRPGGIADRFSRWGSQPAGTRGTCPGCLGALPPDEEECPACGLVLNSPEAGELMDLEAMARQLERFDSGGLLNQVVLSRVRSALQLRRRQLSARPGTRQRAEPAAPARGTGSAGALAGAAGSVGSPAAPPREPEPALPFAEPVMAQEASGLDQPLAPLIEEPAPAPWKRLEQLLAQCRDVRDLSPTQQVQALLWYGQAGEAQLAGFPPGAQLTLARLLAQAERTADALRSYRRLLTSYPQDPGFGGAALEAGFFADRHNRPEQAILFLGQALTADLSESARQEAEAQLRRLRAPVEPVVTEPAAQARAPAELPMAEVVEPAPASPRAPAPAAASPYPPVIPPRRRPAPPPPEPVPPPRPPRRSWKKLLEVFMEERNILWGELVGGLLIVGCSIALVISLWKTLENIPYFPFLILAGVTSALFGAGLYTLHHWKLESTSRGLLVIATLLVPLNFGVMAGFHKEQVTDLKAVLINAAALALFAWLLSRAARVFVPEGRWLLPLAVTGASAAQLLVPPLLTAPLPVLGRFVLLGSVPLACYGLSTGVLVGRLARTPNLQRPQVTGLFAFLGIASFALVVALSLLVFLAAQVDPLDTVLNRLALEVAVAGVPVLACGLLVHRRLEDDGVTGRRGDGVTEDSPADLTPSPGHPVTPSPLALLRTWGTGIALTGILVMLVGVVLAWPQPGILLAVCAFNFLVLTVVAFRQQLPVAHAAAIPCLVVGYLSGVYLFGGHLQGVGAGELGRRLLELTLFDWGGTLLAVLVFLLAAAAEWCARKGRRQDAASYALGGGAIALVSWVLVNVNGVMQPARAALVSGVYAAGTLAINLRWRRPLASYFGLALLITATVWGLEWQWPVLGPVLGEIVPHTWAGHLAAWAAVVAGETLALAVAALYLARKAETGALAGAAGSAGNHYLARPLAVISEAWSGAAIFLGIVSGLLRPWQFEQALACSLLLIQYTVLAAVRQSTSRAREAGLLLIGTVIAITGWAGTIWVLPDRAALIGFTLAVTSAVMAAVSVWATRGVREGEPQPVWYGAPAAAWRETSALAAVLGLLLALLSPAFTAPGLPAFTFAFLAVSAFLLAWRYQAAWLSWVGSALVLFSIGHALYWNALGLTEELRILLALLSHATLAILTGLAVNQPSPQRQQGHWVRSLLASPLLQSGLLTTFLALPILLTAWRNETVLLAGGTAWLATLWLVVAWALRSSTFFTAFQAAMTIAWLYGAGAWIQREGLGGSTPESLQTYGLSLGVLGLVWLAIRLGLRSDGEAQKILEAPWPALDRLVLGAVVVGQLALAVWGAGPGVLKELTPRGYEPLIGGWEKPAALAAEPRAWGLFIVLAAAVLLALWEKRQAEAPLELVLLALTVPALVAIRYADDLVTASVLRWGLAAGFLVCSALLWVRGPLSVLTARLRLPVGPGGPVPLLAGGLVVVGFIVPVLGLTIAGSAVRLLGEETAGPPAVSFFAELGRLVSFAVPLGLVAVGLVGYALRERSAAFALAAGLAANLTLTLGYALEFVSPAGTLSGVHWVRLLQWGSLGAAAWALAWLLSRRWVSAWRAGPEVPLAGPLMDVQVGLGLAAGAGLVLAALVALLGTFPNARPGWTDPVYFRTPPWTREVGSVLGWGALALVIGAVALRHYPGPLALSPHAVGLFLLMELGLAACTAERLGPGEGYRLFMLGCGILALAVSLGGWGMARRREPAAPARGLADAALVNWWVRVAAVLVLLLGLKGAIWHQDHLWAAGAIALASLAGAALAVQHRREDWAFVAGLGVNLAASLVVWHFHRGQPLEDWLVPLMQANVIANAAGTLCWLGVRRNLYPEAEVGPRSGPLLAAQVGLGFLGNAVLLLVPLGSLIFDPGDLPPDLPRVGNVAGWAALALAMTAAVWYLGQVAARLGTHLVGGLALALGVLLACTVSRWDRGDWLAYHVLQASWVVAAGALLVIGRVLAGRLPAAPEVPAEDLAAPLTAQLLGAFTEQIQGWVVGIGTAVVLLAVRGLGDDPQDPYWSAGATLAVSAALGALALGSHQAGFVYASGLLVNLAGVMAWFSWGRDHVGSFIATNALCFGITSGLWTLVELSLAAHGRPAPSDRAWLPYRQLAALLGLAGLVILAWVAVGLDLAEGGEFLAGLLTWAALAATAAALVVGMWDAAARYTGTSLYSLGLIGLALGLHAGRVTPARFGWLAGLLLAVYVLAAALLKGAALRLGGLRQRLHLPARPGWFGTGFILAQAGVGCLVVALSVWTSLAFATPGDRLAGPLAVTVIVLAGVLLAETAPEQWGPGLRAAALVLGLVALAEGGWAFLPAEIAAPWLHRNVILMAALALLTFFYGLGLGRLLPAASPWVASARRVGTALGVLASVLMAVVLAQEYFLYDFSTRTSPVGLPAVVTVAAGLLVLIVSAICFAVLPGRDPLGLSERGRTLYVYAAEALLALLFVHFRLTVPELYSGVGPRYRPGAEPQGYWAMTVMILAFIGVGLSEYFQRKGLAVLAEPLQLTGLFLPVLPLVAFWFEPPLADPALAAEDQAAAQFGSYALIWFAAGALYSIVAMTRRSFGFALLAALAVNFGLWSVLYQYGWKFLIHPQMWLIPLALIALVAEHVNRNRLSRAQSTSLRYLALGTLYLSSTADMFITGVGNSVLLPLVLAVLSILGVLAGILLRVRAFLFLGVAFLFLVIFSMIWHAAVDRTQTWVWWASGIVLGVAIVALFAVFEKRRNDVLRLIDEIKKWD
jgi:hypothetical protein